MEGRWKIEGSGKASGIGTRVHGPSLPLGFVVPVVPCDDAAIKRAVRNVAFMKNEPTEQDFAQAGIVVAIVLTALRDLP